MGDLNGDSSPKTSQNIFAYSFVTENSKHFFILKKKKSRQFF